MSRRIALRSRSVMKLSTAAPRHSRKEWPVTFWGVYPHVLGAESDTKSLIAVFGGKHHLCAANRGGSKVSANPVENWNEFIQGPSGNESPGESIGLPRKHRGEFRPLRSALCPAQRASRIDRPNRERWRGLRKCQTRTAASGFAEVVGAAVSSNDGLFWRFEGRCSFQSKNQLPLSRRFRSVRGRMIADLRRVAERSQCAHLIAVGLPGPSEPTELLPLLRPTLRRYRVIVFANSLRDPGARVRNLLATSVSTRKGTERAPVFYAYSSSDRAAPPESLGVGLRSGG
jgi:hypothetical protein